MFTTAMLHVIHEAGEGVLVLIDGLDDADFGRSRLTRQAVRQQLQLIANTLGSLPAGLRAAMPELDWDGWRGVAQALQAPSPAGDDSAWFAARALVPATLSWLRVYRQGQPGLFNGLPPRQRRSAGRGRVRPVPRAGTVAGHQVHHGSPASCRVAQARPMPGDRRRRHVEMTTNPTGRVGCRTTPQAPWHTAKTWASG